MGPEKHLLSSVPVRSWIAAVLFTVLTVSLAPRAADAEERTLDLCQRVGIDRGLVVLLEDDGGTGAIALARQTKLLIYVQIQEETSFEKACQAVDAAGFYGTRVFVDRGSPGHLHLADNLADVLVAPATTSGLDRAEVLRVLRPRGRALLGTQRLIKPVPEGIDDWTHPYHLPDNNPQSRDTMARAPYLTQFLATPHYASLPQVTVSSAGRVFRAHGHIAFKPREERWANTLMAYNGYNGTILWHRDLLPGIMVHRNTLIASPTTVYHGDHESCKLIDAVTGKLMGEIIPPVDQAGGTFWKWMALDNGVLYALLGAREMIDPEVRNSHDRHGWPWTPLSRGYNLEENPWGFGHNLLAIDVNSKKVRWRHREKEAIDSRALCMRSGKIYIFRFGSYLACLDAAAGTVLWKKTAAKNPELFRALGKNLNRQDWRTNWRTTAYLKCSDQALYFAGPMFDKLIALSTEDGSVLWQHPYDNFQLVLREDGLYGISGPWANNVSKKFDPLSGKILAEFDIGRRACTRPTGSADAIFFRANGGSIRFDLASASPHYVSPMRPTCHDGVTIANGLLYWWPSTCDCQNSLYGVTCLGPAGKHDFHQAATEADRLTRLVPKLSSVEPLKELPSDWPTFRANNARTAVSGAAISTTATRRWNRTLKMPTTPTAPVAAGGLVFIGGADGIVRAHDISNGTPRWKAYTGGAIRLPPTVWQGRLLVGSGDGHVHAFEASTGRPLWRFRAAPEDRKIPVYGTLLSTWPAASGVLVEDGIAYVAAGISNFDGTHVYALDAATGAIVWHNHSSGHLDAEARTGIGVQGHLLLHRDRLYMAGGNAVSPAIYDLGSGACLNDGSKLNIGESICLRGWELSLIGDEVAVGGQPFYRDPKHPVVDHTVTAKMLHLPNGPRDLVWLNSSELHCYTPIDRQALSRCVSRREYPGRHIIRSWGQFKIDQRPLWKKACPESVAIAACSNAVLLASKREIVARRLQDGEPLWSAPLSGPPVPWGLAVDSAGHVILALEDGQLSCFK